MDFTYESVNKLYAKGLINAKDRSALRVKLLKEQNQYDGLSTKFVNNLVEDFQKGWADLVVAVKGTGEKFAKSEAGKTLPTGPAGLLMQMTPAAEAAWHALALLTMTPVVTAAGRTSGQQLQDVLMSKGVPAEVTVYASALLDASVQLGTGQALAKVAGVLPKASDVIKWVQEDSAVVKKFQAAISDQTVKKAQAIVGAQAKAAEKEAEAFISGKSPSKGLEDLIDIGIADEKQRAALQAANRATQQGAAAAQVAEEASQRAAKAMKSQEETHDLLGKAMETFHPKELSDTEKTLAAAAATIRGGSTAEQTFNAAQMKKLETAADSLLERMKRPGAMRGGAPSYQDYIDAGKRAQASYTEGKRVLDMGKMTIEQVEEMARTTVGKKLDDLRMITPGDPVDPLEVISNSLAVKDHAQELHGLIGKMRKDWTDGNKQTFYHGLAEFYRILEVDPNYRMPLQTAGQSLRAAGNPAVNSTRYLDDITDVGSWLAGEKLNTVDELEANALNIIGRLEQIPSWEKAAAFAKTVAGQDKEVLRDPTFRDKARFWFINSIMSGTDTIGRNISGNMVAAPWHYAEKMTGVAASKVLDPFLSAKHHVETGYASEANAFAMTWASSMWDASRYALTRRWDKLADMIPEKARADLFAGRYDLPKFANTGTTNPFGGNFGRVVGSPVGIAQTADEVARVALYRGAVSERLRHEWLASKSPMSWGEFRERGMANVAPDMHDYGIRMAGQMTYSDDPSVFGRLIMQGREAIPGSEFLIPFVKTTDRLMAYGYNKSPVLSALSTKTISEFNSGDPLLRQEAIGRILLANITGAGLFLAARAKAPDGETFITGGGPTNRALAKSLRDGGVIHPYTFWTPAGRFNYHLWQPVAAPLGLVADTAEIWDELKTPDAEGLWTGALLALSRNFIDTTYNQQIANIVGVFDNPSEQSNLERIARQTGASLIKGFVEPAIVRQILRNYDPTVKEVYDFQDELLKDIPGYGGPAKINLRTGEPVLNPPRLLQGTPFGWVLPTAPIQAEDDAVRNKFLELKIPFPQFPKAYGGANPSQSSFAYSGPMGPVREAGAGIAYTPDQINKGQRYVHEADESGLTADQELKEILADPEFNKLAPVVQAEQIQAVYNSRLSRAVGRLREEHPELDVQLEAKRQLRGELRMNPEDRADVEAEENSTPDPVNEPEAPLENFSLDFGEQQPQPEPAPVSP
jgi:hypothetical protein